MEARDYSKLVEALRSHLLSVPLSLLNDAADAIEDLQKGLTTLQKCYEIADKKVDELLTQLPKRGEWIKESYNNQHNLYRCSVCGLEMLTNPDYVKKHKFCFKCGAKMEVQDG